MPLELGFKPVAMRWLHVHALAVMAIAQPLFDQFGRNSTFFVAHRASSTSIWLLTLALFLVPGLVLAGVGLLVSLMHRRVGWWVHCATLGLLAGVVFLPPLNRNFGPGAALPIVVAMVVAVGVGLLYAQRAKLRPFLTYMAAFTVVMLGLFVFASGVSDLLFGSDVGVAGATANDTSVVLIVLDELPIAALLDPELNFDETRAPNLVRFANEQATWYDDAITWSPRTQWAVPTILTGIRAGQDSIPIASQFPQNLFTLTAGTHDLLVAESVTQLCPDSLCAERQVEDAAAGDSGNMLNDTRVLLFHTLLPGDLASRWLPPISTGWTGFEADETVGVDPDTAGTSDTAADHEPDVVISEDEFHVQRREMQAEDQQTRMRTFAAALQDNVGPTVSYAHMLLPHAPWQYLPDGTLYNGQCCIPGLGDGEMWTDNEALLDQATHRFFLQLRFADQLFGDVIAELERTGQFDDSLIIVTADHGTSFVPGTDRREAGATTLADVASVPLFVKYPNQAGPSRVTTPVEMTDVLPTIADVLDIELREPVDGLSLLDEQTARPPRDMMRTVDIDDFEAQLDLVQAVERLVRVLPNGVLAETQWGTPATRSLIGTPVADLDIIVRNQADDDTDNEGVGFRLEVPKPRQFTRVDPDADRRPVRFLATVEGGSAPDGTVVVVAVNGVVAGATEVVDGAVSAMLNPALLPDGRNAFVVFEYDGVQFQTIDTNMETN